MYVTHTHIFIVYIFPVLAMKLQITFCKLWKSSIWIYLISLASEVVGCMGFSCFVLEKSYICAHYRHPNPTSHSSVIMIIHILCKITLRKGLCAKNCMLYYHFQQKERYTNISTWRNSARLQRQYFLCQGFNPGLTKSRSVLSQRSDLLRYNLHTLKVKVL